MDILPRTFERIELFYTIQFPSDWWICKESFYCQVTCYGKAKSIHFYYFRSYLFSFPNDMVILLLFFVVQVSLIFLVV